MRHLFPNIIRVNRLKTAEQLIDLLDLRSPADQHLAWQALPSHAIGTMPRCLADCYCIASVKYGRMYEFRRRFGTNAYWDLVSPNYASWKNLATAKLKIDNPKEYRLLRDGMRNHAAVLSIGLDNEVLWHHGVNKHIKRWAKIGRASDLFVKGMGTFDVLAAARLAAADRAYTPVISPAKIQAIGYFPTLENRYWYTEEIFKKGGFPLEYLIRWKQYMIDNNWMARIDELGFVGKTWPVQYQPEPRLDVRPEWHANRFTEWNNEQDQLRERAETEPFEHLADVPDLNIGNDRVITVLKTPEELKTAGKAMHNCAGSYAYRVASKESVVALLVESGKPMAMGELAQGMWRQIVGPCNRSVSQDVADLFTSVTEELVEETEFPITRRN